MKISVGILVVAAGAVPVLFVALNAHTGNNRAAAQAALGSLGRL